MLPELWIRLEVETWNTQLKLLNFHFLCEEHVKLSQEIMILTFGSTLAPAVALGWSSAVPLDLEWIAGSTHRAAARPPAMMGLFCWLFTQNNSLCFFNLPKTFSLFQRTQVLLKVFLDLFLLYQRDCYDQLNRPQRNKSATEKGRFLSTIEITCIVDRITPFQVYAWREALFWTDALGFQGRSFRPNRVSIQSVNIRNGAFMNQALSFWSLSFTNGILPFPAEGLVSG